jgi:Ricin-type beta-trefoil lectin domain
MHKLTSRLSIGLVLSSIAIFTTPNIVQALGNRPHHHSAETNRISLSQAVVNGRNVNLVRHSGGSYKDLGNGNWGEANLQGKTIFSFKETGRDEWSVYLLDESRAVNLQLDLHRKKVVYSDSRSKYDLYPIVQASSVAPVAQSYRSFKTDFTGDGKCLDVVNDGTNNQLQMADCGNFSGQFWSTVASGVKGYVRLRNNFTGDGKCLDVVNDGTNNKLQMADCGNFTGQLWQVAKPKKAAFYRMSNQFTGSNKCLDIVNDGTNNKLQMADCGNFTGQFWRINKK